MSLSTPSGFGARSGSGGSAGLDSPGLALPSETQHEASEMNHEAKLFLDDMLPRVTQSAFGGGEKKASCLADKGAD